MKLLIIIKSFKYQRYYFKKSTTFITILSNYINLQYFITIKNLIDIKLNKLKNKLYIILKLYTT